MAKVRKSKKKWNPDGIRMPLTDRHKVFICQCWAEFKTLADTLEAFVHEFKADIEAAQVFDDRAFREWLYERIDYYTNHRHAQKWKDLARRLRQEWLAGTADLILAHKRPRIEELQKLYRAIPESAAWKVLQTASGEIIVEKRNDSAKVQVLEQIRKEVEGDKLEITGTQKIVVDFQKLTYEQIERIANGDNPWEVIGIGDSPAGDGDSDSG